MRKGNHLLFLFSFARMRFEKESDVEDGMRSEDVYVGSGSVCVYVCVCMYVCVMVEKKMME